MYCLWLQHKILIRTPYYVLPVADRQHKILIPTPAAAKATRLRLQSRRRREVHGRGVPAGGGPWQPGRPPAVGPPLSLRLVAAGPAAAPILQRMEIQRVKSSGAPHRDAPPPSPPIRPRAPHAFRRAPRQERANRSPMQHGGFSSAARRKPSCFPGGAVRSPRRHGPAALRHPAHSVRRRAVSESDSETQAEPSRLGVYLLNHSRSTGQARRLIVL